MTYALQGGLENPQLVVNPFSAITPGITRELMQITPSDPRIVPRKQPSGKNDKGARSSNSPAIGPRSKDSPSDGGGWSSELNQNRHEASGIDCQAAACTCERRAPITR